MSYRQPVRTHKLGVVAPEFLVTSHCGGMSMVRISAPLAEPCGCLTQVFSRGRTGVRFTLAFPAAFAAPQTTTLEQLINCTTLCAGGIGGGTVSSGKPGPHGPATAAVERKMELNPKAKRAKMSSVSVRRVRL